MSLEMSIENKVFLTGTLAEDNDLRDNIIVDGRKRKLLKNRLSVKSQEWGGDAPNYALVDIKIWDEDAERIFKTTQKGDKISIVGRLEQSFQEFDEEGLRRCGVCVNVRNVKEVFCNYHRRKRQAIYEIDLTAMHEIFESQRFVACYYIRRLGEDFMEYVVHCEDKNDRENFRSANCRTKAEICDFINERTDIRLYNNRISRYCLNPDDIGLRTS